MTETYEPGEQLLVRGIVKERNRGAAKGAWVFIGPDGTAPYVSSADIVGPADMLVQVTAERDTWQRRAEFLLHRRPITEADIKRGQEIWALLEAEAREGG